jgi:hypothetical protein
MSEENKTRRAFIKTAAQVAVTAPAVTLLLNASTKPATAESLYHPIGIPLDCSDDQDGCSPVQ